MVTMARDRDAKVQQHVEAVLAHRKLHNMVADIDAELDEAIGELSLAQMDRLLNLKADGVLTGYLATARRLGKKPDPDVKKPGIGEGYVTTRVQSMLRSREAAAQLSSIVSGKDNELLQAIISMDKREKEGILCRKRDKYSQFSAGNTMKKPGGRGEKKKAVSHEFATPRVKFQEKSRAASRQLTSIVQTKDHQLKRMIKDLSRTEKEELLRLTSNCGKSMSGMNQGGKVKSAKARHEEQDAYIPERIKQMGRARAAENLLKTMVKKKDKSVTIAVKKMDIATMDRFLQGTQASDTLEAAKMRAARRLQVQANLDKDELDDRGVTDASRYVRAEVCKMGAIWKEELHAHVKSLDQSLQACMGAMNEQELELTLANSTQETLVQPSSWREMTKKKYWRHLGMLGVDRKDAKEVRKWRRTCSARRKRRLMLAKMSCRERKRFEQAEAAEARPTFSCNARYTRPQRQKGKNGEPTAAELVANMAKQKLVRARKRPASAPAKSLISKGQKPLRPRSAAHQCCCAGSDSDSDSEGDEGELLPHRPRGSPALSHLAHLFYHRHLKSGEDEGKDEDKDEGPAASAHADGIKVMAEAQKQFVLSQMATEAVTRHLLTRHRERMRTLSVH